MLITWPDKETRDSGWETYLAQNIQASLDEQFPDVEQCGGDNWENVYGFAAYKTRDASVAWDRENTEAMVSYRFCSYQENKEPDFELDFTESKNGMFSFSSSSLKFVV